MRQRFCRTALLAVVFSVPLCIHPDSINADSAEKCAERLEQAHQHHRRLDVLKALKVASKRCSENVAIHLEAAHLYMELQNLADEDWLHSAFEQFCLAVEADTTDLEARRHLANLLMYMGEYELALPHFEWLAAHTGSAGETDARAQAVTCAFLSGLSRRSQAAVPKNMRQALKLLDLSDSTRVERSEWKWLEELNCAVAIAAMHKGVAGADRPARVAHCFLFDWTQEPFREDLDRRVEILSGMLSSMTTLVRQNGLETDVKGLFTNQDRAPKGSWPEAGFAGPLEAAFLARKPDTLRLCTFSDSLVVNHVWRTPDLRGNWHCKLALPVQDDAEEKPPVEFDVEIKQQADSVYLLLPVVAGEFASRSRLTMLIDGWRLKTHAWEQFATVNDNQSYQLTGELRTDESYDRLDGMMLRFFYELHFSSFTISWSKGGGQYTLERR